MLVGPSGKDCFAEIKKDAKGATKVFTSIPPPVAGGLLNTMIPGAAVVGGAAGLVLAPAAVPAAAIAGVGGYVASIASAAGRRKLVIKREEAAMFALASLLEADYTTVSSSQVKDVQSQYGVPDEQFEEMIIDIYKKFILAMVRRHRRRRRRRLPLPPPMGGAVPPAAAMHPLRSHACTKPVNDARDRTSRSHVLTPPRSRGDGNDGNDGTCSSRILSSKRPSSRSSRRSRSPWASPPSS